MFKRVMAIIICIFLFTISVCFANAQIIEQNAVIEGNSLFPLANVGDNVTNKLNYYTSGNTIQRDDLILYDHAGKENLLVKIVKAIPGDSWDIVESQTVPEEFNLTVNGSILENSQGVIYSISGKKAAKLKLYKTDYAVIPPDVYLILGNLPGGSFDSTEFGLVHKNDIKGHVVLAGEAVTDPSLAISSIAPTEGPAGKPVIVTGTGFSTVNYLEIGGTKADNYTIDSDTQIMVNPDNYQGKIKVRTAENKVVESADSFSIVEVVTREEKLSQLWTDMNSYTDAHYDDGTQRAFQAMYVLPTTPQVVKDSLIPVWTWINSVMAYYYGKKQAIRDNEGWETVTWDFSQFDTTDPNISLEAFMGP